MDKVTVTCVQCGKAEQVENTAEELRGRKCPDCGGSMVVKRRPGEVSQMPR